MPDYKVPVNDYLFLFNDVLDMQSKYKDVQGGDEATTNSKRITIFAVTYNILRISGGRGGVAYSN